MITLEFMIKQKHPQIFLSRNLKSYLNVIQYLDHWEKELLICKFTLFFVGGPY